MNITLKIGEINLLLNHSLDVLGRNGNSDVRLSSLLHNIFVLVSFQGNRLWLRAEKKNHQNLIPTNQMISPLKHYICSNTSSSQ